MSQDTKTYIVPINVETMRIGYQDDIEGKFKWPEFNFDGMQPIATGPDVMQPLIESNQGVNPVITSNLNGKAAGIRLHWALPNAVVKGNIGRNSNAPNALEFPVIPNRWLITAYYLDNKTGNKSCKQWIVESDALLPNQPTTYPAIVVPNPAILHNRGTPEYPVPLWAKVQQPPGFKPHKQYIGNVIKDIKNWQESKATNGLDALSYFGPSFTAYYMNGATVCGFFDNLKPSFDRSNCDISASYQIIGWYSDPKDDIVSQTFQEALKAYPAGSKKQLENIPAFIRKRLKWEFLSEYESPPYQFKSLPKDCQSIFNGMAIGISFNKTKYLDQSYSSKGINIAVGNNIPEAISSLLINNEDFPIDKDAPEEPKEGELFPTLETKKDLEFLLNAFQQDILRRLNSGNVAHRIEKVETLLHNSRFGTYPGGTTWLVRAKSAVNNQQPSAQANEIELPFIAAKTLSHLNALQANYDDNIRQIETSRQQLFLDWTNIAYHKNSGGDSYILPDDEASLLMAEITEWFVLQAETGMISTESASEQQNAMSSANFIPRLTVLNTVIDGYLLGSGQAIQGLLKNNATPSSLGITELNVLLGVLIPSVVDKIRPIVKKLISITTAGKSDKNTNLYQQLNAYSTILKNVVALLNKGYTNSQLMSLKTALSTQQAALGTITDKFQSYAKTMATGKTSISDFYKIINSKKGGLLPGDIKEVLSKSDYSGIYDIQDSIVCLEYSESTFATDINTTDGAYGYVVKGWKKAEAAATAVSNLIKVRNEIEQNITNEKTISNTVAFLNSITSDIDASQKEKSISNLTALLQALNMSASLDSDIQALTKKMEALKDGLSKSLPIGHQVISAIKLMNMVTTALLQDVVLQQKKAPNFHFPNEPVIALSQKNESNEQSILRRVNRNGISTNLPCREHSDLITSLTNDDGSKVTLPTFELPQSLQSKPIFTDLLQEGARIAPENGAKSIDLLKDYAKAQWQEVTPPIWANSDKDGISFKGKLPYYIGLNVVGAENAFLPLFIAWKANFTSMSLGGNNSNAFQSFDKATITDNFNFVGSDLKPSKKIKMEDDTTGLNYNGQMFLTDSGNVAIIQQLVTFLKNRLNFDPTNPPATMTPLESELYETYLYFKNETVLAQGLSGFNPALLSRIQNYTFPFNFFGNKVNLTDATGLLATYTEMWEKDNPNWKSYSPISKNGNITSKSSHFLPIRAGRLNIDNLAIVDVFGRFINFESPEINIADSLKFSENQSMGGPKNSIYMSPKIVQPSRLRVLWEAADFEDKTAFVEYNAHPAYSPVCGWLMTNHLDDSMFAYDKNGDTLGYFDISADTANWRSKPMSNGGGDNNLLNDIKNTNSTLQDFITKFLNKLSGGQNGNFSTLIQAIENTNQFLPTTSLNKNIAQAILKGRPLMLAKIQLSLEIYGKKAVAINAASLSNPSQPSNSNDLQQDVANFKALPVEQNPTAVPNQFPTYNQLKRNTAGVENVTIPVILGNNSYLNDGLVGYFKWDDTLADFDYTNFHVVSDIPTTTVNGITIKKADPISLNLETLSNQSILVLADPSVPIHAISGVLPEQSIQVPPDEYQKAMDNLKVYLNATPVVLGSEHKNGETAIKYDFPLPKENGYQWSWVQPSLSEDQKLTNNPSSDKAVWNNHPLEIQDGWLKMEELQEASSKKQ